MIKIYGCSDDLVEIEGDVEYESSPNKSILIGTEEVGLIVKMKYVSPGVWQAQVRQIDEGKPIPWDVSIKNAEPGGYPNPVTYSVMVVIDCPLGTPVKVGKKKLEKAFV